MRSCASCTHRWLALNEVIKGIRRAEIRIGCSKRISGIMLVNWLTSIQHFQLPLVSGLQRSLISSNYRLFLYNAVSWNLYFIVFSAYIWIVCCYCVLLARLHGIYAKWSRILNSPEELCYLDSREVEATMDLIILANTLIYHFPKKVRNAEWISDCLGWGSFSFISTAW